MKDPALERLLGEIDRIKQRGGLDEDNTKRVLILPFIQYLGFDIFSSEDLVCEFKADFRDKGKVDYALMVNDKPYILIEAKAFGEDLSQHIGQLKSYYVSSTDSRFGVLTNGVEYWFFDDSHIVNIMDDKPFYRLNLTNLTDEDYVFLRHFSKSGLQDEETLKRYRAYLIVWDFCVNNIFAPGDDFLKFIKSRINLQVNIDVLRELILQVFENWYYDNKFPDKIKFSPSKDRDSDGYFKVLPNGLRFRTKSSLFTPEKVTILGVTFNFSSWRNLSAETAKILVNMFGDEAVERLLDFDSLSVIKFAKTPEEVYKFFEKYKDRNLIKITDNLYMNNRVSSLGGYRLSVAILKLFDYGEDDIQFHYSDE